MKYIIEIEDVPFSKVRIDADNGAQNINLYRAKGFNSLVFDQFGLDKLTPLDKALEEAYQKGYDVESHEATTLEYQQGLDDAWECARKIFGYVTDGGLTLDELRNVFGVKGVPFCTADILRTNTASEALAKIKAYEEQQKADERIMFGDGLVTKTEGLRGIALSNEVNGSVYVWREDCVAYESSPQEWRKTGENLPQVAELLEAMKGGA